MKSCQLSEAGCPAESTIGSLAIRGFLLMPFTLSLGRHSAKVLVAGVLLWNCALLRGNDSAVETGAGGIQLRKEARISMQRERLTISLGKVTVEYEFLNTTDQDITTEVAFPIPPYVFDPGGSRGRWNFSDFRVWVDGNKLNFQTEVRAQFKGIDHTDLLRGLGINIQHFANYDENAVKNQSQFSKLPKPARENLIRLGLINVEGGGYPTWSVLKTYHWSQRFPAHKIVRVRHEYNPVVGFRWVVIAKIRSEFKDACIDPSLERRLRALVARNPDLGDGIQPSWVKYILTTANTWKTPIKDFELVVERPGTQFISFCWDGKVGRVGANRLVAKKADFVPTQELSVYFLPNE